MSVAPVTIARKALVVAALYANGASAALTAEVFGLSVETVKTYVKRVGIQLGAWGRVDLLAALDEPGRWVWSTRPPRSRR